MSVQRLRILVGDELIASVPSNCTVSPSTATNYALLAFERWLSTVPIVWEICEGGEVVSQGEVKRE